MWAIIYRNDRAGLTLIDQPVPPTDDDDERETWLTKWGPIVNPAYAVRRNMRGN